MKLDRRNVSFPEQVFKDTVAIFVVFAVLFTLAVVVRAPLGRLADPTDTSYVPRPEWYFLFLFQTLKFFEGPLEIVGGGGAAEPGDSGACSWCRSSIGTG